MSGRRSKKFRQVARKDNDQIWNETLNNNLLFRLILAVCIVFKLPLPFKVEEVKK